MAEPLLQRHDLVWVSAAGAREALPVLAHAAPQFEAESLLFRWVKDGYPLIVTRQPEQGRADWIQLGLALPPSLGKQRLAFSMPRKAIVRSVPPPLLAAAANALPEAWDPMLHALLGTPEILAVEPRVFGSAAMQAATGLPCLGAASDLDLLLSARDFAQANRAVRALAQLADRLAPRLDGELRNPAGEAVAWRELLATPRQVLVKGPRSVTLVDYERYADSFPGAVPATA